MKLTAQHLIDKKQRQEKIVALTCYDYPSACIQDAAGVDLILVGDSVGTNVLGYADVSKVTVDDMAHHVGAVARGVKRGFVLCDAPFGSFQTPQQALQTARRLMDAGADGVKIEGELTVSEQIRCLIDNKIPVCAHIGFMPQTRSAAAVHGKDSQRALELLEASLAVCRAGAFMMVLELVAEEVAQAISTISTIPTIGIGSGRFCDGQVQVLYDMMGFSAKTFRHVKTFANGRGLWEKAIGEYAGEVREGIFPDEPHSPKPIPGEVRQSIDSWMKTH